MKLLVLDNYDSFTYNLVHLLRDLGVSQIDVVRNDKIGLAAAAAYQKIVLSPGPGIPNEAGIMPELVREFSAKASILGVCLGHQCIAEVFGGSLRNLSHPVHGHATKTRITAPGEKLFKGVPPEFKTGRYHSWVVAEEGFPDCLEITARDEKGEIMALSHRTLSVKGVQFHPESVLTEHGAAIIKNWLEC